MFSLHNLSFGFPGQSLLLNDLNANFESVRNGILGERGSGKSTLLSLMLGLERPNSGEIFAFGKQRTSEKDFAEVRQRTGLLFQDPNDQLFCLTVLEDVAFGPQNLKWRKSRAYEAASVYLDLLNIADLKHLPIHRLSFGEKRLVALAGILAMEPEVLLLDDPHEGLDATMQERLLKILLSLTQTLIIATQDAHFLSHFVKNPLILRNGTFIEETQK